MIWLQKMKEKGIMKQIKLHDVLVSAGLLAFVITLGLLAWAAQPALHVGNMLWSG
jgi:hypothetical protein